MLWRVRWWRVPFIEIVLGILTSFGVGYGTDAEIILNWFVLVPTFVLSLMLNSASAQSFEVDALFIIIGASVFGGTLYYYRNEDGPVILPGLILIVGQWFFTAGLFTALRRLGGQSPQPTGGPKLPTPSHQLIDFRGHFFGAWHVTEYERTPHTRDINIQCSLALVCPQHMGKRD